MVERNRKALVVSSVASTIDQFCMYDIEILQRSYRVHVAANFESGNNTSIERIEEFKHELKTKNIHYESINFHRNPFSWRNIKAYKKVEKYITTNCFDIVHCHTPVAAMLVRLAARRARRNGTKVIYTAHGFHFYKGAPLRNWLVYYTVEYLLSRFTDLLITINIEDFRRASNSFKANTVKYIPGVGVNVDREGLKHDQRMKRRMELGFPEDAMVCLSVGELNLNKNHATVIKAIARLNNPNVYYVICGQGELKDSLKELISALGLEHQVKLLGYRRDIIEICSTSDLFIFPSFREGLPVAVMEAMAAGLPVICSGVRGNIDLVDDGKGGVLADPKDPDSFVKPIKDLIGNHELRLQMGHYNRNKIKQYDINCVKGEMEDIYDFVGRDTE